MLHDNNTPLAAIGFEQWKPDGMAMAVIAARGSFEITDGIIRYAGEQKLVLADQYEGDPHRTPLLRPGDLVPFRPRADITLLGNIHARDPATTLRAGLRVIRGADTLAESHLYATGPRHWYHDGTWKLSAPQAVAEVPLDWRHASGGRIVGHPEGDADPANPIGAGVIHPDFTSAKVTLAAPQILGQPDPPSPFNPAPPTGFGPISPWWQPRSRYAGTYDRIWEEERHPLLPADFDYSFYQIAPQPLQVEGYLFPGDRVQAYGVLPDEAPLDLQLPDLMPFAKFSFTDGREVLARLHLDGLHIDLRHGQKFDLTWRSWIPICPSFWRIDLEMGTAAQVTEMRLPTAVPDGLGVA